jgi:hypothetical protein
MAQLFVVIVLLEKPLTHSFAELPELRTAADKPKDYGAGLLRRAFGLWARPSSREGLLFGTLHGDLQ